MLEVIGVPLCSSLSTAHEIFAFLEMPDPVQKDRRYPHPIYQLLGTSHPMSHVLNTLPTLFASDCFIGPSARFLSSRVRPTAGAPIDRRRGTLHPSTPSSSSLFRPRPVRRGATNQSDYVYFENANVFHLLPCRLQLLAGLLYSYDVKLQKIEHCISLLRKRYIGFVSSDRERVQFFSIHVNR